jgi:hypothetical protein
MRTPLTEHQYVAMQLTYQTATWEASPKSWATSEVQVLSHLAAHQPGNHLRRVYPPCRPPAPAFEKEQQMEVPHAQLHGENSFF